MLGQNAGSYLAEHGSVARSHRPKSGLKRYLSLLWLADALADARHALGFAGPFDDFTLVNGGCANAL